MEVRVVGYAPNVNLDKLVSLLTGTSPVFNLDRKANEFELRNDYCIKKRVLLFCIGLYLKLFAYLFKLKTRIVPLRRKKYLL